MRFLTAATAIFLFAISAHAGQNLSKARITSKASFLDRILGKQTFTKKNLKTKNGEMPDPIASPVEPIEPEPLEPLIPIRHGKLKWDIYKTSTTTSPDGTVWISRTKVCTGESDAPVYDARTVWGHWESGQPFTCQSTADGLPVDIRADGSAVLLQFELFNEGAVSDYKIVDSSLIIRSNSDNTSPGYTAFGFGPVLASRQLDVRSLASSMPGRQIGLCSGNSDGSTTCSNTFEDSFDATFEFLENP